MIQLIKKWYGMHGGIIKATRVYAWARLKYFQCTSANQRALLLMSFAFGVSLGMLGIAAASIVIAISSVPIMALLLTIGYIIRATDYVAALKKHDRIIPQHAVMYVGDTNPEHHPLNHIRPRV